MQKLLFATGLLSLFAGFVGGVIGAAIIPDKSTKRVDQLEAVVIYQMRQDTQATMQRITDDIERNK